MRLFRQFQAEVPGGVLGGRIGRFIGQMNRPMFRRRYGSAADRRQPENGSVTAGQFNAFA